MTQTLREAPLTTRSARSNLGKGLHWRAIDPDTHLGYRKGARGGRWLVRWYKGEQSYTQATLATADDALSADGIDVLTFEQAVVRAKNHVQKQRAMERAAAAGPVPTVQDAIADYLQVREAREDDARGAARKRDARSRLTLHVSGTELAGVALSLLSRADLRKWLGKLPEEFSPSTVRRLVNDLKAALNQAGRRHRDTLPAEFTATVREGLHLEEVEAEDPRQQVLADADIRRIIAAAWEVDREDGWEGDLGRMVVVLATAGPRFSQAARLRVADAQAQDCRLMMPVSRKGKRSKKLQYVAFPVGQDTVDALKPAIHGRVGTAPLLERWRKRQVSVTEWVRDSRGAWSTASELTRPWAKIIKRTGLPSDIVPYALRHSSIVRCLRAHLPVQLVARMHDTSAAIIEKHYAAFIVDALDELAARAVVPLVDAPGKVVQIQQVGRG
jgi:integrase